MKKIKQLTIPSDTRVIVISDIHGELELFKELLKKVDFNADDYLIINGDLCEKGSNSKGVVSYVMDLVNHNPKVHVTEGNCDTLVDELINENPKLIDYLLARQKSIFNEWLAELDYTVSQQSTIEEVKQLLTRHYSRELDWVSNLPTAIETEHYIFVHAGLDKIDNWKNTDRETAVTIPAFMDKLHRAQKYVVVGHWPVINYPTDVPTYNPIIDHEKKIIAIDGGNVIKSTGQLNAFIIQHGVNQDDYSHVYTDYLANYKTVIKEFTADPSMTGSINWPDYTIIPVKQNEHFTLCEQPESSRFLYVKNEYIEQNEFGKYIAKSAIPCTQISVNIGDIVSVIDDSCTGFNLIKKDGNTGWVSKTVF
ncbi:metallophosphoesterase [Radiobacillus sp. PE A8.2]|uniref:metallophosphoesterase n=1 Tax=Radiobacillus sp. PE A8.2 TaxID=3380349 RepID=UPI00388D86DF